MLAHTNVLCPIGMDGANAPQLAAKELNRTSVLSSQTAPTERLAHRLNSVGLAMRMSLALGIAMSVTILNGANAPEVAAAD
jgi:hypothetical protein